MYLVIEIIADLLKLMCVMYSCCFFIPFYRLQLICDYKIFPLNLLVTLDVFLFMIKAIFHIFIQDSNIKKYLTCTVDIF